MQRKDGMQELTGKVSLSLKQYLLGPTIDPCVHHEEYIVLDHVLLFRYKFCL